ncbi:C40 family peptidase [Streptomyces corynorhini]|uniref:NlpC/P60 family protein n=1 Tax=Streptomyces corynorhini TaxID=2282652 RepID=A0A370B7G6_9ACTN|nr:C40 family peptidase [Streptomyces corynorhini]RDG37748.1 NlpC/P60 family protein [Streptomyces corynorhini]
MAAHRKRKQRPLSGQAGRTAATLALAGAATATTAGAPSPAHAEPRLTAAQVKAKVDRLYEQAESATERYNGAKVKADDARASLTLLSDEAARRTERLNTSRDALGSIAAAQYRSGGLDPAVQLGLSSKPEDFLEGAALAERTGARQAAMIVSIRRELGRIAGLRGRADSRAAELRARQSELARHKSAARAKLDSAQRLLDRLTAVQRARYDQRQDQGTGGQQGRGQRDQGQRAGAVPAPNSRAAAAVAFAYGAIGKPYVWGATGPGSFDCSGLTQAAWRAAGVSLPRTTYTQINAGRRVSHDQLSPGDLVFFFSGVSHVGIYVGGGQMIHAPRPGSAVRLAPVDQMPFAGAARPV